MQRHSISSEFTKDMGIVSRLVRSSLSVSSVQSKVVSKVCMFVTPSQRKRKRERARKNVMKFQINVCDKKET